MRRERRLHIVLLVWLIANVTPHLIVFLATGKIYYQLPTMGALIAESSIMLLNLVLPVLTSHFIFQEADGVLRRLGWRWRGWRTVAIGLLGLLVSLAIAITTQQLIGDPLATPGQQFTSVGQVAMAVGLLLVLTAAAEEMMFRGWIQTTLTQDYNAWLAIGVTALLFGLRHLPMDLYAGLVQGAAAPAWISRVLQLYLGALVFGAARHWGRSTWASWITHEGMLMAIVILGVLTGQ